MSIADQPAFSAAFANDAGSMIQTGMTYRQWLIGMALQGILHGVQEPIFSGCAEYGIEAADAVIARLDAEGKAAT